MQSLNSVKISKNPAFQKLKACLMGHESQGQTLNFFEHRYSSFAKPHSRGWTFLLFLIYPSHNLLISFPNSKVELPTLC